MGVRREKMGELRPPEIVASKGVVLSMLITRTVLCMPSPKGEGRKCLASAALVEFKQRMLLKLTDKGRSDLGFKYVDGGEAWHT